MGNPNARSTITRVVLMAALTLQCLTTSSVASVAYPGRMDRPGLSKRWHSEPPPVLQKPCLVVDRANDRTYMIGYDSRNTLTFNFLDSTAACDSKQEHRKGDKTEPAETWLESDGFDWKHAQWTSLPYPGGVHQGRRFDTEHCFLSSDNKFMVPSFEKNGEGGFSVWDHEKRTWSHSRIDRPCSCHEDDAEEGGKVKVKKDARRLRFEYPNLSTVVYQSYRAHGRPGHGGSEEAIDTVVIQWKDQHDRDHLTGVQLVNHQVYSCHDIKLGRNTLPEGLTLATSPNNAYHYTYHNTPKKYKSEGDHGSRCENTTLFLMGAQGSGWFKISIADRPSKQPVDIMYSHKNHGFYSLSGLDAEHMSAVYYGEQIYIFGKTPKGVGVWTIDTADSEHGYEITSQSQGGQSPGGLTCASCGNGIIVYGGCDRAEDCSTNLRPGERGELAGSAPIIIYKPSEREGESGSGAGFSSSSGSGSGSGVGFIGGGIGGS
ncbi:hypothetical protein BGZ70_004162, partial [Mortierella alpina]